MSVRDGFAGGLSILHTVMVLFGDKMSNSKEEIRKFTST